MVEVAEVGSNKPLHGVLSLDALVAAPGATVTIMLHRYLFVYGLT